MQALALTEFGFSQEFRDFDGTDFCSADSPLSADISLYSSLYST